MAEATITHERARLAVRRFIDEHFHNEPTHGHVQTRIPADQDDDDIVLGRYIAQQSALAEHAPQPRPVEGAGPAHNHPLPWKHKFCPACEYEVAPSPAPSVEAPTNYEILCVERYHRIQELERTVNALVTLLRAKCSDAQWAELEMKFDVMTEPASVDQRIEAMAGEIKGLREGLAEIVNWSVHGSHANRIAIATLKSEPL